MKFPLKKKEYFVAMPMHSIGKKKKKPQKCFKAR
jgi:hypothetical protein